MFLPCLCLDTIVPNEGSLVPEIRGLSPTVSCGIGIAVQRQSDANFSFRPEPLSVHILYCSIKLQNSMLERSTRENFSLPCRDAMNSDILASSLIDIGAATHGRLGSTDNNEVTSAFKREKTYLLLLFSYCCSRTNIIWTFV